MSQNEGRVALAIQAYQRGQFTSLKAACTSYDAPYSTARDRVKGCAPRHDFRPTNRKLIDLEESTLIQWILSMEQRGLPLRAESVRQMANLLLRKRTSQENASIVGKC